MNKEPFIIERVFDATTDRVWQAITDKDLMKQWYFDLEEFTVEVGFKFTFIGGSEEKSYTHLCEVIEVIPNKKLKHTWRYNGYEGNSFVTWEIFAEGDKTRVKLTHEGLHTFPQGQKDFSRESFTGGWTHILGISLKDFLNKSNK